MDTNKEIKKLNKEEQIPNYNPTPKDIELKSFLKTRIEELKTYRKNLKIEDEWNDADAEYVPEEINLDKNKRKIFEQNQDTGKRSRMVEVGESEENWRSRNSAPTLLSKIQTAISLIIENDPEAMLTALTKKYEKTTDLAYSLWKRNWSINNSKEILKLFVFNLIKYGFAVGRSYPRVIKYNKKCLVEVDNENPEKNKYEEKEIVWFNDVAKENMDIYKTWIDEQTKPYDHYSMNDCYYEIDYSEDAFKAEYGQYPNSKYVSKDSKVEDDSEKIKEEDKIRKDIITVGFYENRLKDLYIIFVPKGEIILYSSPLPNDDGLLSLWHTMWILRKANSPYGVSLWKTIKQNKALYDKMNNMTMDQLVLSIMKFGFYTGTSQVIGDGKINIVPGQAKQVINGKVDWMEIPGPGGDSYRGLEMLQKAMDDSSGITPTMEGDITGKTLGEIQIARESALKRLKVPLENISDAIEQDAYLTLSWMSQVYSTPETKTFINEEEMMKYEQENEIERSDLYQDAATMEMMATYYPQIALHLEDRDGQLYESKETKFFQVGKDILPTSLKWKGMFKVIPRSLVGSSETIMKQTKMELANLLIPLFSMPPELVRKAAVQLIKINEEDEKDWLPDLPGWNEDIMPPMMGMPGQGMPGEEQPLFVEDGTGGQGGGEQPLFVPGEEIQKPETVVPQSEISMPQNKQLRGGPGTMFRK